MVRVQIPYHTAEKIKKIAYFYKMPNVRFYQAVVIMAVDCLFTKLGLDQEKETAEGGTLDKRQMHLF